MNVILFVMFIVVGYLYLTELVIPWYKNRSKIELNKGMQWNIPYLQVYAPDPVPEVVQITTSDIPGLSTVSLPMGTIMATSTVNIMAPVMLVSKQDDIRIYYPDNSLEYFSIVNKKWEKVLTTYKSVYEYATKTDSIIVENL